MRKPSRSGEFDQRVTIVNKQQVYDFSATFGSNSIDQFEYDVIESGVWCSVKYIGTPSAGASEDNINDQRTGKSKIEVEMRYRNDVSHEDIIVYMGGWFEIYSIQEGGRDETTIIRAELRDDDTFTLSVADGYTEDFYEQNPLGYDEEGDSLPIGVENQWVLTGSKTLTFYMDELSGWRPSDINFHLELPVDWFENRTKSGMHGNPGYDDRAKMLISIPEEVDLDPNVFEAWSSQSPSQLEVRPGELFLIDSDSIGANSVYPMVRIEVEMTQGKTQIAPSLVDGLSNFDNYVFPSNLPSSDSHVIDFSRAYTRNYSVQAYETAGYSLYGMTDVLKTGNRYNTAISLRPFIYDAGDSHYMMAGFRPHYFGGSKASLRIKGRIARYQTNELETGIEVEEKQFDWTQEGIDVRLDGDIPFVDLSLANIVRGLETQLKSFPLTEDGVHDFVNNGTTTGFTSHSDYWRVKVENGTLEGTSKVIVELRYDKFGNFMPDTFSGLSSTLEIYPLNIYHRSLYGVTLPEALVAYAYYNQSPEMVIHPSAFVLADPEYRNFDPTRLGSISSTGTPERAPNVAFEDLRVRPKNFKVIVKRVVIPDDWEYGDDVSYEYKTIDLAPFIIEDNTYPQWYVDQNFLGHRYVFDNIPEYIHDDDSSAYTIDFDVEYDLEKLTDDDLVIVRSNEGVYSMYEYNEETGTYDYLILTDIEDWEPIDDLEELSTINNGYKNVGAQIGRKYKMFPHTAHFNLRQKNNLV